MLTAALIMFFAHFVGDFLLQSNWAATNKHHNWTALSDHLTWYGVALLVGLTLVPGLTLTWPAVLAFMSLNVGSHFVIDAVTSRLTSSLWRDALTASSYTGAPLNLRRVFHVIGFDQYLHAAILLVSLSALMGG